MLIKDKFLPFLIAVFFLLTFSNNFVHGAETDNYVAENYDAVFDYENIDSGSYDQQVTKGKTKKGKSNPLILGDSFFSSEKNITLKGLMMRVSFIVLIMLGLFIMAKFYMYKNQISKSGNILDNFAQKFSGDFSSFANTGGLKLRQTLILTPGQNLYLVEIEGKKLLLGGTHQGGVQFLTDLTASSENNSVFRQIQSHNQENIISFMPSEQHQDRVIEEASQKTPTNGKNIIEQPQISRQPFKRRVSFRESLLAGTKQEF